MEGIPYIPVADCIHGHLYALHARNGSLGVFDAPGKFFHLRRFKHDENFAFVETHADVGDAFSTAKPLQDLGEAPVFQDPEDLGAYLNTHPRLEEARSLRKAAVEQLTGVPLPSFIQIP